MTMPNNAQRLQTVSSSRATSLLQQTARLAQVWREAEHPLMAIIYVLWTTAVRHNGETIPLWRARGAVSFDEFILAQFNVPKEFVHKSLTVWLYYYMPDATFRGFNRNLATTVNKMWLVAKVAQSIREVNDWLRVANNSTIEELSKMVRRELRSRAGSSQTEFRITAVISGDAVAKWLEFRAWCEEHYGHETNGASIMRAVEEFRERHIMRSRRAA